MNTANETLNTIAESFAADLTTHFKEINTLLDDLRCLQKNIAAATDKLVERQEVFHQDMELVRTYLVPNRGC